MKKNVRHFFLLTLLAAGTIYCVNRFISMTADLKNILKSESGNEYDWKNGKIYYTKHGTGTPLLLVHDLTPASSSYEWCRVIRRLARSHTVYAIDLLGCGRSDRPYLTYTNFLYVQLVNDFIRDVIGEKTDVVASNDSLSFVTLASRMNPKQIGAIIGINAPSVQSFHPVAVKYAPLKKVLMELPILGTFLYNLRVSSFALTKMFREEYYARPQLISSKLVDAYYEAAHMNGSRGKYLMASIGTGYTKNSIEHALKKMEHPLFLIQSRNRENAVSAADAYCSLNSGTEVVSLSNCKKYPQLEIPDQVIGAIETFLK